MVVVGSGSSCGEASLNGLAQYAYLSGTSGDTYHHDVDDMS